MMKKHRALPKLLFQSITAASCIVAVYIVFSPSSEEPVVGTVSKENSGSEANSDSSRASLSQSLRDKPFFLEPRPAAVSQRAERISKQVKMERSDSSAIPGSQASVETEYSNQNLKAAQLALLPPPPSEITPYSEEHVRWAKKVRSQNYRSTSVSGKATEAFSSVETKKERHAARLGGEKEYREMTEEGGVLSLIPRGFSPDAASEKELIEAYRRKKTQGYLRAVK